MKRRGMRAVAGITALCLFLTGCAKLVKDEDIPASFTVYASFYPAYALAALIIDGDIPGMSLHQLMQPQDGCLRDYALSDWDAYMLSHADAVILNGNGLESFAGSLLNLGENGPAVVQATGSLALKAGTGEPGSHFFGANPWLFLSVSGAMDIAEAICANMIALDPPYESAYLQNLNDAYERLSGLESRMAQTLSGCDISLPVALAHEGLAYFADEWSLNVVCTLERESGVSPTDAELSNMLADLAANGAKAVLLESQAPDGLTGALEAAGYRVVKFSTLSTGNESLGADGYFTAMLYNAQALASALRDE